MRRRTASTTDEGNAMRQQIFQQPDNRTGVSEFRVRLGETTDLTLGSGGGSSEDKRYIYN
jgi:hypothetical protein